MSLPYTKTEIALAIGALFFAVLSAFLIVEARDFDHEQLTLQPEPMRSGYGIDEYANRSARK